MSKKGYNNHSRWISRNRQPVQRKNTALVAATPYRKQNHQNKQANSSGKHNHEQKKFQQNRQDHSSAADIPIAVDKQMDEQAVENKFPDRCKGQSENGSITLMEEMEKRGFQVVRKDSIARGGEYIRFREKHIGLRKEVFRTLGNPEHILFFLNEESKHFAIISADTIPCEKSDSFHKDMIKASGKRKNGSGGAEYIHTRFVDHIFKMMDWDVEYRYIIRADRIQKENAVLLDFDLTKAEPILRTVRNTVRHDPTFPDTQDSSLPDAAQHNTSQFDIIQRNNISYASSLHVEEMIS